MIYEKKKKSGMKPAMKKMTKGGYQMTKSGGIKKK